MIAYHATIKEEEIEYWKPIEQTNEKKNNAYFNEQTCCCISLSHTRKLPEAIMHFHLILLLLLLTVIRFLVVLPFLGGRLKIFQ